MVAHSCSESFCRVRLPCQVKKALFQKGKKQIKWQDHAKTTPALHDTLHAARAKKRKLSL
eukprot:1161833-Pelagomonas_calceolata.AAC.24